jgi:hypothetical protein
MTLRLNIHHYRCENPCGVGPALVARLRPAGYDAAKYAWRAEALAKGAGPYSLRFSERSRHADERQPYTSGIPT